MVISNSLRVLGHVVQHLGQLGPRLRSKCHDARGGEIIDEERIPVTATDKVLELGSILGLDDTLTTAVDITGDDTCSSLSAHGCRCVRLRSTKQR